MPVPVQGMGVPQSRSGHFGGRNMDHRLSQYRQHHGDWAKIYHLQNLYSKQIINFYESTEAERWGPEKLKVRTVQSDTEYPYK